ncbi:hypothetical protein OG21DRAFT_1485925 [Imleria badia]|nr:hypothetical protein OG21DRAFT_1485925 [Imleria badia]
MLKGKEQSVVGLTKGIEMLFKQDIKGASSFVSPTGIAVQLLEGGETEIEAKNVIIATGSEVVVSSIGALELQEVPNQMVVIGGGIIGLEMGSVWSLLGAEATVVEFLGGIGGAGIDEDVARFWALVEARPQDIKVMPADKVDEKVLVKAQFAKGDKETASRGLIYQVWRVTSSILARGRRRFGFGRSSSIHGGLNLEAISVEKDNIIDDQFNSSAEEEGIAAVEYFKSGHGHVNYNGIPYVVPRSHGRTNRARPQGRRCSIRRNVGKFPFAANSQAKINLDSEGFVKLLSEGTNRILGVHITFPVMFSLPDRRRTQWIVGNGRLGTDHCQVKHRSWSLP